ncbi:hypothetical protein [Rhodothermus profundi]|uniref:SAV-6107-like HEPN domain-containing protein n=1 Tax=Rhodothermus profundi TaxID=633813 RepID=A0A1M6SQR2_9BACT|nr:hypothetical protein [Rhodothermus profundi]SHK47081.1 hypothetical protein SAMN04488087_1189 [Rhodothermus profundi]
METTIQDRTREARTLLATALQELQQARQALEAQPPDYRSALDHTLQALSAAFRGFLTWHDVPVPEDASLHLMARPCMDLASSLRLYFDLLLPLEAAAPALRQKETFSVTERERIRNAYFTARNAIMTVLGELPAALHPSPTSS